jgi:hypothetical protein
MTPATKKAAKRNVRQVDPFSNELDQLWKGKSLELLKQLHILTREGKLNQDSRRKLKQVYHLTQLMEPAIQRVIDKNEGRLRLYDLGAGKSYLGFILYDLMLRGAPDTEVVSVETRKELVQVSQLLAEREGFERMRFVAEPIEKVTAEVDKPLFVCALHACDTATDDALAFALRNNAAALAVVPCCQAEVSRQLERLDPKLAEEALGPLWHYPIHRREFGSHLTNVIRSLVLQAHGYRVTVTELVGWEHSMKNELILAERISDGWAPARDRLAALLRKIPVKPKIMSSSPY